MKNQTKKVRVDELEARAFAKAPSVGAESRTGFQPTQRFGGWQRDFIDDVKDGISTENEHSELDREMISQIHCSNSCINGGIGENQNEHYVVIHIAVTS